MRVHFSREGENKGQCVIALLEHKQSKGVGPWHQQRTKNVLREVK